MIAAERALERLRDGNRRFVEGVRSLDTLASQTRRGDHVAGQAPFAVILGCSDSRVPVEIVFDQGLGDLFVIRVAGNIVAPSQIGSVEFAAERFGTRLVVVLGHTHCGAVQATLEVLQGAGSRQSRNLSSIVDRIRPSVEGLLAGERVGGGASRLKSLLRESRLEPLLQEIPQRIPQEVPQELVRAAVRANVRVSVEAMRHGSEILERLIEREGLLVVGAEYSLETGAVEFFAGP